MLRRQQPEAVIAARQKIVIPGIETLASARSNGKTEKVSIRRTLAPRTYDRIISTNVIFPLNYSLFTP
jgi:hypothetical protein